MSNQRDSELGRLLRELDDAPPSDTGLEARIWARIDEKTWRDRVWHTRSHRAPLIAAAALAVAALLAIVVLFGVPGASRKAAPATASAAVISARMAAAMSSFRTLSGTMTQTDSAGSVTGIFTTDSVGDYSLRYAARPPQAAGAIPVAETYDARRHILLDTYREPDGRLASYKWDQSWPYEDPTGAPGGAGAPFSAGDAWLVRVALADDDPSLTVHETVFGGRPAWRVTLGHFLGHNGESLVVDQQTGFLVGTSIPAQNGWLGYSISLTDLRVDQPLPADIFATVPPSGSRLNVTRAGFYCRLDQVASRVGFRPFTPASIPAGYRLTEVATDGRWPGEFLGWSEPDVNDPHRTEFLRYRDGFNAFAVQIASMRGEPASEACASMRASLRALLPSFLAVQVQSLTRGPFAARSAHTWFDDNGANLIVVGDRYVAFISGALTRQQLYATAEALRQH